MLSKGLLPIMGKIELGIRTDMPQFFRLSIIQIIGILNAYPQRFTVIVAFSGLPQYRQISGTLIGL